MLNMCAVTKFCIQTMTDKSQCWDIPMKWHPFYIVDISIPPTASPENPKSML